METLVSEARRLPASARCRTVGGRFTAAFNRGVAAVVIGLAHVRRARIEIITIHITEAAAIEYDVLALAGGRVARVDGARNAIGAPSVANTAV